MKCMFYGCGRPLSLNAGIELWIAKNGLVQLTGNLSQSRQKPLNDLVSRHGIYALIVIQFVFFLINLFFDFFIGIGFKKLVYS